MTRRYSTVVLLGVFFCSLSTSLFSLTTEDILTAYRDIRSAALDPEQVIPVGDLIINKDAMRLHLKKGKFYLHVPVLDRVVGGVFVGEGVMSLTPADKIERENIKRMNEGKDLEESIEEVYLLFTDNTHETIMSSSSSEVGPIGAKALKALEDVRKNLKKKFSWNIPAKMMADLSSEKPAGYFIAFIKCRDGRKFVFEIDPKEREEVRLYRYESKRRKDYMLTELWYSSHAGDSAEEFRENVDTENYTLDVTIDEDQRLSGEASIVFASLVDGVRMLEMNLDRNLRVSSVTRKGGIACAFIQENAQDDADFWVLFPEPLRQGDRDTLTITYSGKGVITDVGGGNYYVGSRTSWYPNFNLFRDRAFYAITYTLPAGLTLISTGTLVKEWEDPDGFHAEWKTDVPFTVVGFNCGRFEEETQKDSLAEVTCFTNRNLQDDLYEIKMLLEDDPDLRAELMMLPQELTTGKMTKNGAIQGINAYNVFDHYFGDIPFKKISISQQPSGAFGQSWPTLIYMPFTALLKPSVRTRLGLTSDDFYVTVAAHEVAHQWWGHMVGYETYRDQWMDEGFAQYSAALYIQQVEGNKSFQDFMKEMRKDILNKVEGDTRLTDVGPISLGYRLSTIEHPGHYYLIYHKGAYVLHMLRMMMYDHKNRSDERFIRMMKDYVTTYSGCNATTGDFQSIVEKHFGKDMNWFFDQWVYGMAIPRYQYDYSVEDSGDDTYLLLLNVTQKGVPEDFEMPVPFVINFQNGYNIVNVDMKGSGTIQHKIRLPLPPQSIIPNPWESVLAEFN